MKTFAIIAGVVILVWIGGVKACDYAKVRHTANWFPEPIKVGLVLVHEPGCDLFWCAGGTLFSISDQEAQEIAGGGLEYLNSLPSRSRHDRPIAEWTFYSEQGFDGPPGPPPPSFAGEKQKGQKRVFYQALKDEDCFTSNRGNSDPLLVICVKAKLAYMGWFD